jgi:hypothetical protein
MNHKEACGILQKGGLVRLPDWPKHRAVRGMVRPRLVHALLTSTGAAYVMEVRVFNELHEEPIAKREDFEVVLEATLKTHAVQS